MAITHATLFFIQGPQQWVEQFFRDDPTFESSLAATLALARARVPILGAGVSLTRVRVSQLGARGNSVSRGIGAQGSGPPAVPPSLAGFFQLEGMGERTYYRPYYLHGLPSGALLEQRGIFSLAPQWVGPITSYFLSLVSGGWRIQAFADTGPLYPLANVAPVQTPTKPSGPITGAVWTPFPLGGAMLGTIASTAKPFPPNQSYFVGSLVQVSYVRWSQNTTSGKNPINGKWQLLATNDGVISWEAPYPVRGNYLSGGFAQFCSQQYLPISGYSFVGPKVHKVGPAKASSAGGSPEAFPLRGTPVFVHLPPPSPPAISADLVNQLTIYQTPAGVVPVPPPPIVPPPPPPPPPDPFVPKSIPVRAVTLTTMADVGIWLRQYCGYFGFPGSYNPIGIGQVTNLVNTWAIFLYGQKPSVLASPGALSSVATGISLNTEYLQAASEACERAVPANCNVLIYGYSLGGMIGELLWSTELPGRNVLAIVNLGSPITCLSRFTEPVINFAVPSDLVPALTPYGFLFRMSPLVEVGFTFVKEWDKYPDFPASHEEMCLNPDLASWNCWGQPIGGVGGPIEVAPLGMFPVPGL